MAKQTNLYAFRGVNLQGTNFTAADTTVAKNIIVAGADDSLIRSLSLVSNDASARVCNLLLSKSGTDYVLGAINVPANAGTDGTVSAVDLLTLNWMPLDSVSKKYLPLQSGCTLKLQAQTTISGGATITALAVAQDY